MTIEFNGAGGLMEGDFGTADINVNLDAPPIFDDSADFFYVAHHADLDASNIGAKFTLSAWVYVDSSISGEWNGVIVKNDTGGSDYDRPYSLVYNEPNKQFRIYIGDDSAANNLASSAVAEDCWNHIAVTYHDADDDIIFYINGVKDTENLSFTRKLNTAASGQKNLSICAFNVNDAGAANVFKGNICDVRIYKDNLDLGEIQVLASKINPDITLGAGTTDLVAHWSLMNGSVADEGASDKGGSATSHTRTAVSRPAQDYDAFSVKAQSISPTSHTTTDGTLTVTQG